MPNIPFETMERLGLRPSDLRDPYLRRLQKLYDELALYPRVYPLEAVGVRKEFALVGHIGHHLGKAAFKLAQYFDSRGPETDNFSAVVQSEAMPEALITRTRTANLLRVDLARLLASSDRSSVYLSGFPLEGAMTEFALACGTIDAFVEPLEEGRYIPRMRQQLIELGIPAMHAAGVLMADHFRVNPAEAHADRLQTLIAQNQPQLLQ